MTSPAKAELLRFALTLSEAAGAAILPYFRSHGTVDIKQGADWDPVTEGDRAGERAIRHLIEKHYPDHGILGEEYGVSTGTSNLRWILDPVDGTRAFVIGLPTWATLIALYDGDTPLLGVMSQPFVGDTFYGDTTSAFHRHGGNERAIRVRPCESLAEAYVGTTTPHRYSGATAQRFESLRQQSCNMRYGGDAYFFSLMASGLIDLAMDPELQIYDIAALVPIITGAGGCLGTWTDNNPQLGGNVLAAATPHLLAKAQAIMAG
jgi:myo-inositol-1(or 4)-monophosphatase